jgi:hypothetical protein
MPGLVPGIHDFLHRIVIKTWVAGTSPAMTDSYLVNLSISGNGS